MWNDLDRPPLNAAALRGALTREGEFWRGVEVVAQTGSTNADLVARAGRQPGADRQVLVAEHQTAGRGRHDRAWVSPPRAALMVSALVRLPGVPAAALGWAPLLTGVALVDGLRSVAEVDARLKWPNDVLVGGLKLGGVLVELVATAPVPALVIGFGINATQQPGDFPPSPVTAATSLRLAGARTCDRGVVARATLRALGSRLSAWIEDRGDASALAADYRARSATLGTAVRATMPGDRVLTGTAVDIDADGRLLVRDGAQVVAVSAADITHLRPQG